MKRDTGRKEVGGVKGKAITCLFEYHVFNAIYSVIYPVLSVYCHLYRANRLMLSVLCHQITVIHFELCSQCYKVSVVSFGVIRC